MWKVLYIFGLVKKKGVRAWTDYDIHIGNTTTNKVEFAHSQLKKNLADNMVIYVKIGFQITRQHTQIQVQFEKNMISMEHKRCKNHVHIYNLEWVNTPLGVQDFVPLLLWYWGVQIIQKVNTKVAHKNEQYKGSVQKDHFERSIKLLPSFFFSMLTLCIQIHQFHS